MASAPLQGSAWCPLGTGGWDWGKREHHPTYPRLETLRSPHRGPRMGQALDSDVQGALREGMGRASTWSCDLKALLHGGGTGRKQR